MADLDGLIAVARFDGVAREAVHTLKYQGRHAISGMMGRLMAGAAAGLKVDVVVPVPLHRSRRRERGFDQAAMLASCVARTLDRPCTVDALKRIRPTVQQATLHAVERNRNVEGAFRSKQPWNGESILLVDDVATTGATINSAASALREAHAGPVVGLVFAYAV